MQSSGATWVFRIPIFRLSLPCSLFFSDLVFSFWASFPPTPPPASSSRVLFTNRLTRDRKIWTTGSDILHPFSERWWCVGVYGGGGTMWYLVWGDDRVEGFPVHGTSFSFECWVGEDLLGIQAWLGTFSLQQIVSIEVLAPVGYIWVPHEAAGWLGEAHPWSTERKPIPSQTYWCTSTIAWGYIEG